MDRYGTNSEQKQAWMRDRHASVSLPSAPASAPSSVPAYAERHFRVAEVASTWGISPDTIRKIFQGEAGVVVLGTDGSGRSRRYTTLLIPASVLERVHRRLANIGNGS